ncbi:MAG: murein biosynthesis integral membrane protein MurJ [Candidatus Omnitrophota bacterium]|jgi:putative peptidoglycan lipid II flippase
MKDEKPESSGETKRHLVRAAGLLGVMTLTSRALGMVRDVVSAKQYGTSWQWDAFVYAFMLPNFFRRIIGEGALSSAFIPVYSEESSRGGREQAFRFANVTACVLAVGLAGFILIAEIVFHWLLAAWSLNPRVRLTVELLRFMFPYLWFMSLYALTMGILNCHKNFFSPALAPIILDVIWIGGIFIVPAMSPVIRTQLQWLCLIILFSGFVQVAVQIPEVLRLGMRFRWIWDTGDKALRKTFHLLLPSIFNFAIVQMNLLLDTTLAFLVGPGANSALWYGNRLMQFPLGMFAITMGTALLPTISSQAAQKDLAAVKKSISFAMRSVFFIILPSTVGLIALALPITRMLFERGEFDAASTVRTAAVVVCYSIGLFAYSGQKIMANGFYAFQETRTPVKIGAVALATNAVLNLILMWPMKEAGLALATSIAGILQLALLFLFFRKRMPDFPFGEIFYSFGKILVASLAMGGVCLAAFGAMERLCPGQTTAALLVQVGAAMAVSAAAYVLFCYFFRVQELREAAAWIIARRRQKPA